MFDGIDVGEHLNNEQKHIAAGIDYSQHIQNPAVFTKKLHSKKIIGYPCDTASTELLRNCYYNNYFIAFCHLRQAKCCNSS